MLNITEKPMSKSELTYYLGCAMADHAKNVYKFGHGFLTGTTTGKIIAYGSALGMTLNETFKLKDQQEDYGRLGQ